MRALIAGAHGQLGRALQESAPSGFVVIAPPEVAFNITDADTVRAVVNEARPDVIINAAAYTAVDRAESDETAARLVNVNAVGILATAARIAHAAFTHVSTDFVFDGTAHRPYEPCAQPNPLGVYGRTKLDGEVAASEFHPDPLIVRTAWVYAARGNNFVATMLRLMREHDEVRVVADQIGTPTYVPTLARTLWTLIESGTTGTFHATDAGVASWYDFALAIYEEASAIGLLSSPVTIVPIRSQDYLTLAIRPAYAVLDKTATWSITGPAEHWRVGLRVCLAVIKDQP